jgi:uncharacterized protein DUF3887
MAEKNRLGTVPEMMKYFVFLLAVFLAVTLAGCKSPAATKLSGEDREAVLAFSEDKTNNLLNGLESGDYAVFSKDFDQPMRNGMPENAFQYLKQDRDAKLGKYVSRTVEDVAEGNDGYTTVIYRAVFEREKDVIMRVVFRQEEPHEISGLWFNK